MEKEHRQLLQSSVDAIKGLTKAFDKESGKSSSQNTVANVARIKTIKHDGASIGLLQDIKKLLQAQFKFTKARDREAEFEADKAKKGPKWQLLKSKKGEPREEGGGILSKMKGMGWVKILLLIIAGIIAFGAGTIVGIFQSIFNFFKWLGKIFPSLSRLFRRIKIFFIHTYRKFIRPIVRSIKTFFTTIGNFFARIFGKNSAIGKVFTKVTKFLKPIINIIKTLFGGGAGKKGFFSVLKTIMSHFFKIGKVFGKLLGPIGLVITIVMALFDFVKGFKGTEGSFFQKLMGGLGGLFAGLIGMPLDLIKNAIAWIFEKFGWTKLAAKMKKFSFSDIIKDFFKFIPKLVGIIKDFFKESPIGKVIGTLIKIIFWPITLIVGAVKKIIDLIKKSPGGNVKSFFRDTKLGKFISTLFKIIFWPITAIVAAVKGIIKLIKRSPGGNVKSFFKDTKLGQIITTVFKLIISPFTLIVTAVKGIIGFFKAFKSTEGGFFEKLIGGLGAVWDQIKGFFSGLIPQFVKDFFTSDTEGEVSGITNVLEKIGGFFATIGSAFGAGFTAVIDGIGAAIALVWNTGEPKGILNKIGGFFGRIRDAFIGWTEESALIEKVREVIDNIKNFFKNIAGGVVTAGKWVAGGVGDLAGGAVDAVRQGISSFFGNSAEGQTGGTVLKTGLAKIHQGEFIINPNLPTERATAQLSALSGQLAIKAAGGMSDRGTGGDTNVTTVAPVTNNNTEIYRTEPGVVESTLSKINN